MRGGIEPKYLAILKTFWSLLLYTFVKTGMKVGEMSELGCLNSVVDSHGLICVSDSLCSTLLLEDERQWNRMSERKWNTTESRIGHIGYRKDGWDRLHNTTEYRRIVYYRRERWIPTMTCPTVYRVGDVADGGKWVCNLARLGTNGWSTNDESCLVLSFGIVGNFRFEEELAARAGSRCVIEMFDPGARKWLASNNTQFRVHELGLSTVETEESNFKSYATILKELGYSNRRVSLLKMDIEGAEKGILQEIVTIGYCGRLDLDGAVTTSRPRAIWHATNGCWGCPCGWRSLGTTGAPNHVGEDQAENSVHASVLV